jgi:hypothetical protein
MAGATVVCASLLANGGVALAQAPAETPKVGESAEEALRDEAKELVAWARARWLDANGGISTVGSAYIVHLNSQAEYDYCP